MGPAPPRAPASASAVPQVQQQQHPHLVQLQVTFCVRFCCDFILGLSFSIAFACQVALVPAAPQVLLVPTLEATCLVQAALEAACLVHQAHLLLDLARQLLDQAHQALGGEVLQCMLSKCFTSSSALIRFCRRSKLCCLSAHSFDVTSQRSFAFHSLELRLEGFAMLQVWTATGPARHLRCITTATATAAAAAQPFWCITAASATEPATVWSLWCCAVATAATLPHHTAGSRSCAGFSGDCSNRPCL